MEFILENGSNNLPSNTKYERAIQIIRGREVIEIFYKRGRISFY